MCGGIAAALIYDFILCPRKYNFSTRRNVLLNGPEDENNVVEITREDNGSPGPSQWPTHWTTCYISAHKQPMIYWYALILAIDLYLYFWDALWMYGGFFKNNLYFNKDSFSSCFSVFISKYFQLGSKWGLHILIYITHLLEQHNVCLDLLDLDIIFFLSYTVLGIILFNVFGKSPKYCSVVKQHKDVDQVIAPKSTLHSS